jgi:flavin reductase (DIM6/NTAB) family NADH-FMN oxidoreductase RutF
VNLATTHNPKGGDNVMAVGWTTTVSYNPRMLLVAIDDAAYTYELIRETNEFEDDDEEDDISYSPSNSDN